MFFTRVRLSFGLLACQQDYTETAECIFTIFGWRMGLSSEQNLLNSGADPDKVTDPIFLTFCAFFPTFSFAQLAMQLAVQLVCSVFTPSTGVFPYDRPGLAG